MFRYRDEPRPIVATLVCDVSRTTEYDWEEMVTVRVYHCWRCTGESRLVDGVKSFEVASCILTNSAMEDTEFVVPKYDLMTGRPFLDASISRQSQAQTRSAKRRKRGVRGSAPANAHDSSDDESENPDFCDEENVFQDVEIDPSMLEEVADPKKLRIPNLEPTSRRERTLLRPEARALVA